MTTYELLSITVSGVSAILVAGALLVASYQLKQAINSNREAHIWNRRSSSQCTIDEIRAMKLDKLNDVIRFKEKADPIPLDHILNAFESDWGLLIFVRNLYGRWQSYIIYFSKKQTL